MLKNLRSYHLGLATLIAVASMAACSGGGCGNCSVPPFNSVGAGVIPTPTPTPLPPGVTATPTPTPIRTATPTPTPTPTPSPTPTLAALSCSQSVTAPTLGAALSPFAVLAGSTVTNVGNTLVTYAAGAVTGTIHDDLIGVWPSSAVTGFYPPGTDTDGVNAIYAATFNTNTAVPAAAQAALTTAYGTISGTAPTTTFVGTPDLASASSTVANCGPSGNAVCPAGTLGAGVYKASTTASIATGNLTLDGGGNPQSVFIFEIGTALTTTLNGGVSGNVILINNAGACNIFWTVGVAATLGGSTFYGNVLASTGAITINATTFTGRALANTTAVTIPVAGGSIITNPGGR